MLEVTTAGWAITLGLIAALLILDLGLSAMRPHAVGFREAAAWSVFYIGVAIGFGVVFGMVAGWDFGAEYFAGYVVEKSLSVDNLFVFVVIMTTFAVPAEHQQKVLIIGIVLALILRAIFIALGAALLSAFSFMFVLFGLLLIFTAVQLFRHREQDPSIEDNAIVGFARRRLPFTDQYDGGKLRTRVDGRKVFTPLFIVLIAIGSTDILFALDSIPAIFGITQEAYIVFAANAFALLGLRALFFLVSGPARPARLPLDRPVADPGVHRREADPALRPPAERRHPGDRDVHEPDRDRRDPRRHHRREPHEVAARPGRPRPRRLDARSLQARARIQLSRALPRSWQHDPEPDVEQDLRPGEQAGEHEQRPHLPRL